MQVKNTTLDGVKLITPHTMHEDFRGSYVELYNRDLYRQHGIDVEFVEDDISTSTHHVLRGVHGDGKTWKLVSCLVGRFYLLVVNNDPAHPQYRKWQGFTLSDVNRLQVLIRLIHLEKNKEPKDFHEFPPPVQHVLQRFGD